MKYKILSFIMAATVALNMAAVSVNAEEYDGGGDILIDEPIDNEDNAVTEVTTVSGSETETTITTEDLVSAEEFQIQNEALQMQIDEMKALFESNGYNIDGLSGEIDGLQMSLDDLYSLISTVQGSQNNKAVSPTPVASKTTTPVNKTTPIETTVTTTTVVPDTSPNAYLVESVKKYPEERDFISVTTRDGHVFYLVIDYEGDEKKVYFLNTVDTADLKRLLETGTTTGTAEKKPAETETETIKTTSEEKEEQPKKKNNTLLLAGGVLIGVIVIYFAKKKLSGGKNKSKYSDDSDDDTTEENENFINEDNEEYDDFREEEPEVTFNEEE